MRRKASFTRRTRIDCWCVTSRWTERTCFRHWLGDRSRRVWLELPFNNSIFWHQRRMTKFWYHRRHGVGTNPWCVVWVLLRHFFEFWHEKRHRAIRSWSSWTGWSATAASWSLYRIVSSGCRWGWDRSATYLWWTRGARGSPVWERAGRLSFRNPVRWHIYPISGPVNWRCLRPNRCFGYGRPFSAEGRRRSACANLFDLFVALSEFIRNLCLSLAKITTRLWFNRSCPTPPNRRLPYRAGKLGFLITTWTPHSLFVWVWAWIGRSNVTWIFRLKVYVRNLTHITVCWHGHIGRNRCIHLSKMHWGHCWLRVRHHTSLGHVPKRGHRYRSHTRNRNSDRNKIRDSRYLAVTEVRAHTRGRRATGWSYRTKHHLRFCLRVLWVSIRWRRGWFDGMLFSSLSFLTIRFFACISVILQHQWFLVQFSRC